MANHCWICPSKNKEDFYDIDRLCSLLSNQFPDFDFEVDKDDGGELWDGTISVYSKAKKDDDREYMFGLMCYNPCPFTIDEVYDDLDKNLNNEKADDFIKINEIYGLDLSRCVEIRHCLMYRTEEKACIKYLQKHFNAVWFDEGTGSEPLMPPKETDKEPKKTFIQKFGEWLLNKS